MLGKYLLNKSKNILMSNISMEKQFVSLKNFSKIILSDFPGGPLVKNLSANVGNNGLIPGPGRSHMPWSN